jgi:ribonuclease HII
MIAAAVRAEPSALPEGIRDSKRLTPARREALADALRESDGVEVGVGVVSVERIDAPETDMNRLTVAAQVEAVAAIARDADAVIVDAGDVNEGRFGRRVCDGVAAAGVSVDVTAEHRADDRHALVGAASIVAKVERDARIESIADEYGDVGSGYPSDPATREFLRRYVDDHDALPGCARTSWKTCSDLLAAAEQSALSEF